MDTCTCPCPHCSWQKAYGAWYGARGGQGMASGYLYGGNPYGGVASGVPAGWGMPVWQAPAPLVERAPAQEEASTEVEAPSFVSSELVYLFANSTRRKRRREAREQEKPPTKRGRRDSSQPLTTEDVREDINTQQTTRKTDFGPATREIRYLEAAMDARDDENVRQRRPIVWPEVAARH
jgi:hypothetical protein